MLGSVRHNQGRLARRRNVLAFALAVLALAFQALVPGGFMVSKANHNGLLAITLCTSNGNIAAFMDQNGAIVEAPHNGDLPNDSDHNGKGPCAFASHGAPMVAPIQSAVDVPALVRELAQANAVFYITPGLGLAAPPPPKTGPPIQA